MMTYDFSSMLLTVSKTRTTFLTIVTLYALTFTLSYKLLTVSKTRTTQDNFSQSESYVLHYPTTSKSTLTTLYTNHMVSRMS